MFIFGNVLNFSSVVLVPTLPVIESSPISKALFLNNLGVYYRRQSPTNDWQGELRLFGSHRKLTFFWVLVAVAPVERFSFIWIFGQLELLGERWGLRFFELARHCVGAVGGRVELRPVHANGQVPLHLLVVFFKSFHRFIRSLAQLLLKSELLIRFPDFFGDLLLIIFNFSYWF